MNVKVSTPASKLEQLALTQRLDKLGLVTHGDGAIDPASAKKVQAEGAKGVQALEAVAPDGLLGLDGASRLEARRGFLGWLRARDPSISEKHSAALGTLAMNCDGLAGAMKSGASTLAKLGLHLETIQGVTRRAEQIGKSLDALLGPQANLAACSPESVKRAALSLANLAQAGANFGEALSEARVQTFTNGKDLSEGDKQVLLRSLIESNRQLGLVGDLARVVSATNIATAEGQVSTDPELQKLSEELAWRSTSGDDALQQLEGLTAGLESTNQAIIEAQQAAALQMRQSIDELKDKLTDFNTTGAVKSVARFVQQRFNPPDSELPPDRKMGLVLGAFDAGEDDKVKGLSSRNSTELNMLLCAMSPDKATGDQKLVLTPNGLRVYGPSQWGKDKYTARTPTPQELGTAGWSITKLEAQLGELAKVALQKPGELEPIEVRIDRTDVLHTEGLQPTADLQATMKDVEAALSRPAGQRGQAVVELIEREAARLSPGELRDFGVAMMSRVAATSQGGAHRFRAQREMRLWMYPSEMSAIRDAVASSAYKAGMSRDDGDMVPLAKAMKDLFYATASGTVSYKVFDPSGREVQSSDYSKWCDVISGLKPWRSGGRWYD